MPSAPAPSCLARLVFAQEDERRRIAREMHDQFGEQLTALALGIGTLKDACGDSADLRAQVEALERGRAAAGSRRRSSGLGAPADRARRSRPARGAGQLRAGLVDARRASRPSCTRPGCWTIGCPRKSKRRSTASRRKRSPTSPSTRRRQQRGRDPRAARRSRSAHRRRRRRRIRSGRRRRARPGVRPARACRSARRWSARRLQIESAPGRGTTILVRMRDRARPAARTTMAEQRRASCAILLADDHVTVRHGLKLLIDGQPDMKVVVGSERRRGGGAAGARAQARRHRHGHLDAGHERAGRDARS